MLDGTFFTGMGRMLDSSSSVHVLQAQARPMQRRCCSTQALDPYQGKSAMLDETFFTGMGNWSFMWLVSQMMLSPPLRREKRSSKIELRRSQRGGGHTDGGTVVAVPSKIEKRWRPGKAFVFACGGSHK